MNPISIVDYGAGNILSIQRALTFLKIPSELTNDPKTIIGAKKILLPGVGSYGPAMQRLTDLGLDDAIKAASSKETPILGICLGMQLLLDQGYEFGCHMGLGLIPGQSLSFRKISADTTIKVPHMGWSKTIAIKHNPIIPIGDNLKKLSHFTYFYYAHSFTANPTEKADIIAECTYEGITFPAAIQRNNIMGCQFHPEKSGPLGLKLLHRFSEL